MFNYSTLQTNLLTVTGFLQPLDPAMPTLDADLKTALSGVIINDGYAPYITIDNIRQLGLHYTDSDDDFSTFLTNRLKASITNLVQKCVTNDNTILEQKQLYYQIGEVSDTITNDDSWVGLKLDWVKNSNVKLKINRIGLHFSGAETDLTFYLYNQNTEQTTFTGSVTGNDFVWVDVSSVEITNDKNGAWFLFYKQADLTNTAINNNCFIPTNTSNFIKINPFKCDASTDLNTIDSGDFQSTNSYIAELDFSIVPDLTGWITYNKLIFARAIKMQFILDIYKMMLANENVRSNRNQRNIDTESIEFMKLNVYDSESETMAKELNFEIETLRKSFGKAKIDRVTLPTKTAIFNYGINL